MRGVVDRLSVPGNAIVALCDPNIGRVEYYNDLLEELGQKRAKSYTIDRFEEMLDVEKVEVLVVTTVDAHHDKYISELISWMRTPSDTDSPRSQARNQGRN